MKVTLNLGHFAVSPVNLGETLNPRFCEKNWLAVTCLSSPKGYQVAEGDVLKMGRLKFRVKELKSADPSKRVSDFSIQDLMQLKDESDESEDETQGTTFNLPCKICLSEYFTDENPLICPCNCDGTMKYIHLKCLQRALRSKVTSRSSESTVSFSWKSMSCDLCKRPYPYKFMLGEKVIELIQIPKPPEKYIILEGLCKDKDSSKWLHVISLHNKESIRVGRSNECELRVTDISVSRLHSSIKLIGESFFLEDKGSKFGTLVQVKRPIALEDNFDMSIQAGRTVLVFNLKKPWSIIPACFRPSSSPYDIFSAPYVNGRVPLLPIGTGIPLSIGETEELLARAGLKVRDTEKYKLNDNLMFEHGQLGMNSSIEDEEEQGVVLVQEIEPARTEQQSYIIEETKNNGEQRSRRALSMIEKEDHRIVY